MKDVAFGIWDQYRLGEIDAVQGQAYLVYDHHFRQVELAESLGFDQYYVIEHQSSFMGHVTSPTGLLAALTQRTNRIRLGAMIWQLPFHNPLRLAQDVATLDQLSHGRIEFGTGLGVHEHEFIRWQIDFEARQEMSEEALKIIRLAWTADDVTYAGKFWSFNEALPTPRPYQDPYPPIWAAVHSRRAIDFAVNESLNIAQNIDTTEVLTEKFRYFRDQWDALRGGAPRPKTFLMRAVYVGETDDVAHEVAEKYVPNMFALGRDRLLATKIGTGTSSFLTGPRDTVDNKTRRAVFNGVRNSYEFALKNGVAIVGSPDTVADEIQRQCEACDLDVFCAEFYIGSMPTALADESMVRFGKSVIPRLRSLRR